MQRILTRSIQNSLHNLVPKGQEMEHCWETDSESSDEHMFIEDSKPVFFQSKLNTESDEDSSMEMDDRYNQILTKKDIQTMNQILDWCKKMLQPQQKRLSYQQVLIDDTQLLNNHRTLRDQPYKPTVNSTKYTFHLSTDTDWLSEEEQEDGEEDEEEEDEEEEDEEQAYKAFEKEQLRYKNRYYRNLKLSQKNNASKHIIRRPLNQNPNTEQTVKSHSPKSISSRDTEIISTNPQPQLYKPFYFNFQQKFIKLKVSRKRLIKVGNTDTHLPSQSKKDIGGITPSHLKDIRRITQGTRQGGREICTKYGQKLGTKYGVKVDLKPHQTRN